VQWKGIETLIGQWEAIKLERERKGGNRFDTKNNEKKVS